MIVIPPITSIVKFLCGALDDYRNSDKFLSRLHYLQSYWCNSYQFAIIYLLDPNFMLVAY